MPDVQETGEPGASIILVAAPRSGAGLVQALWCEDRRWSPSGGAEVRSWTIDWLPRHSLHLRERAAPPGTGIVHVVRDPRMAVPSLVHAWRSGRFITEPDLESWWGEQWSFPLVPHWRELVGRPLHEVAAAQWMSIEKIIREDLSSFEHVPYSLVTYEELVADPQAVLARVAHDLGVSWSAQLPASLPLSPFTLTAPNPLKWQRDIVETLAAFDARAADYTAFLAWAESAGLNSYRAPVVIDSPSPLASQVSRSSEGTAFMSQHTSSMAELLTKAASSLAITTYKSGHLIIARAADGIIDTNVTSLDRPMGIATHGSRLAVGTGQAIATYVNQPGVAAELGETDRAHDAVFLPRSVISTGDVAIHEMGYDLDGRLWFVNTKFSCLCTQEMDYSFAVAWVPAWITELAAEDRCHLNGMTILDGKPRFVTALARTNTPAGWRQHKGTGGVIIDITDDRVVAEGLAMPHSPRWHDGRLWVLQSGVGSLSTVDVVDGSVTEVARVPGFSRGLAFLGRYALIGLSQVRESVFAGLPITATAVERNCGVWVVDTVTGSTMGFLRFEGAVQEIFDVAVLPGLRWPTLMLHPEVSAKAFVLSAEDLERVSGTRNSTSASTGA